MVLEVDFLDQDGFAVMRRLGQDAAERVSDKRTAPELEPDAGNAVAAHISIFMADAVDRGNIDAVGNRVGALNGLPRVILRLSESSLFPPDASRWRWDKRADWHRAGR